MCKIL
jgi:hypothetical protein